MGGFRVRFPGVDMADQLVRVDVGQRREPGCVPGGQPGGPGVRAAGSEHH